MPKNIWLKHFIHDRTAMPADQMADWLRPRPVNVVCSTVWEWNRALYPSARRALDAQGDIRPLRDAVREAGAEFHAAFPLFHDPHRFEHEPHLRPLDKLGEPYPAKGWYRPLSPADPTLREILLGDMAEALEVLQPDGLVLDFCRWPFFWEEDRRYDSGDLIPPYDYSEICLREFSRHIGVKADGLMEAFRDTLIDGSDPELCVQFLDWRAGIIHDFVREVRAMWSGAITVQIIPPMRGHDLLQSKTLVGTSIIDDAWMETKINPCIMLYHEVLGRDIVWIERCLRAIADKGRLCLPSFQVTGAGEKAAFSRVDFRRLMKFAARCRVHWDISLFSTAGLLSDPALLPPQNA